MTRKFSFARGQWDDPALQVAYTFRYTQTPEFKQGDDFIASAANPDHPEKFDNISLLYREPVGAGVTATLHSSFEGLGCPEIILVEQPELCEDGAVRYGACFEIVLYKNGINVWRHYRDDGKCHWHKRLGWQFPVTENEVHELTVSVRENYLDLVLDGKKLLLRTEDLFERFNIGMTVCEGVARLYDFTVETAE